MEWQRKWFLEIECTPDKDSAKIIEMTTNNYQTNLTNFFQLIIINFSEVITNMTPYVYVNKDPPQVHIALDLVVLLKCILH